GGDRPRFGGGNERSGGGDRPRFGGNERSGGGGDRPRFGGNEPPQRAGGFVQGGKPAPGKFAPAGDKRAAGKGFGARQSFSGNAATGRDRDPTQASPRRDDDSEA
ncbi:MAG: hypothetical protein JWN04_288, partial [Myxococcaceae bacterium]|nr:hypothetical protein [Myxococcaceae bacterium]